MRCPKCGFISFDHLTACGKCGRDIAEVASELQGTSIKVEAPMFLSGALAAFAEREEPFEEHAMEAEVDEGIDFDMAATEEVQEAPEMAAGKEEVDFSFEEETGEADISLAEAEAAESAEVKEEAAGDFGLEAEAEEEPEAVAEADDTFEELDFMGVVDDEEEGGLEFDLEDFMEDMDDDKTSTSAPEDASDIDLDLDDEEK